jgi:hypothetical protein
MIVRQNLSSFKVGFEVLKAVGTKMAVFWVVAPCSMVEIYQRFREPSASIIRATTQKTAIQVLIVPLISDLCFRGRSVRTFRFMHFMICLASNYAFKSVKLSLSN